MVTPCASLAELWTSASRLTFPVNSAGKFKVTGYGKANLDVSTSQPVHASYLQAA